MGRSSWALLIFVLALALLAGCAAKEAPKEGKAVATYIGAKYVGSEKCKDCHQKEFYGWKETMHPYQEQEANIKTVIGDFYVNNTYTAKKFGNYTTKMFFKDGKYYVTTLGAGGKEETYEILRTVGGAWKQRYITKFPSGEYHILPVQWNVDTKQWVDYHGLDSYAIDSKSYWANGNVWQTACAGCHTVNPQLNYDEKTKTYDTKWTELGVGCESCHGPGSNHVESDIASKPFTIVNPDKLPPDLGAQICGRCHNRGSTTDGKYDYPKDFEPGIGSKQLNFNWVEKPGNWPSGDSKSHRQQYIDYKKSKHFEHGIQCWDCHTPHARGVSARTSLKMPSDALCKSCHGTPRETEGLKGLTHTIHDFGSCTGCHMPRTMKTAVDFDLALHTFKPILPRETISVLVDMAMKKDKSVLDFYGLKGEDVEGLNRSATEALLKNKAAIAMGQRKSMKSLMAKTQPNSCNLCHDYVSPWTLQERVQPPRYKE